MNLGPHSPAPRPSRHLRAPPSWRRRCGADQNNAVPPGGRHSGAHEDEGRCRRSTASRSGPARPASCWGTSTSATTASSWHWRASSRASAIEPCGSTSAGTASRRPAARIGSTSISQQRWRGSGAEGATPVKLIGASMGGTAVLVAGSWIRPAVAGIVSLSGPYYFRGLDALRAVRRSKVPVRFLVSRDDRPFSANATELMRSSKFARQGDSPLHGRGTRLIDPERPLGTLVSARLPHALSQGLTLERAPRDRDAVRVRADLPSGRHLPPRISRSRRARSWVESESSPT